MKNSFLYLFVLSFLSGNVLFAQNVRLPNGWFLSPAGHSIALTSDLPLNMALAADGIHVAVTNNGNGNPSIDLINLKEQKVVASKKIKNAWMGLAFSKNHLYASGGNDNIIVRYRFTGNDLINDDSIVLGKPWPKEKISPAGLTIDEKNSRLYVVTKEDNSLYICDTKKMKVLKRIILSNEAYSCILNPKGKELYISAWGGSKIWIYNVKKDLLSDSVKVEDHPSDLTVSSDGKWLYAANANSNSVSVINLTAKQVIETLHTAISPDAPIGSTTNSVALSADQKTLYIANADNNYLSVFDVSKPGSSHSLGFIPVGWYPTCVRISGKKILVANGKGLSSMSNVKGGIALQQPSVLNIKKVVAA